MKTLDEAIAFVIMTADSQPELLEMMARQASVMEMYRSTINELMGHKSIERYTRMVSMLVLTQGMPVNEALASVLVNGVIIGIEMEKSEWPQKSSQSKWAKKITALWGRMAKKG